MTIVRQPWRWLPFGFRLTVARLRSRLSQYRLVRRCAVGGVVALTLVIVGSARAQSADARQTWGDTIDVLVVVDQLGPGESFDGNVELVARPAAFVPADALRTSVDSSEHAVRSLEPGDTVTERDLVSSTRSVRLGPDQRAMSLPLGPGIPSLEIGDEVELYVVFDSFGLTTEEPDRIDSAVVIDIGDDDLTIAVGEADVAMLAQASTSGRIIVARR